MLTPPFVHPQALATATAAVEEVKATAAAAELAVAEAEEAQRDAVPEIAAQSAALIAIRTHQIQVEAFASAWPELGKQQRSPRTL